jgi:hypothetical protein
MLLDAKENLKKSYNVDFSLFQDQLIKATVFSGIQGAIALSCALRVI